MANIHEAIAAIMADCPAITKSQKNQQQGFMYRGIDVVMNVLQPLMIKHKVFVVPEVIDSVVVHELCHRKEMNHSARFYAEVLRVFPDYPKWHRWLKETGSLYLPDGE